MNLGMIINKYSIQTSVYSAKQILLNEGDVSHKLFYIKRGALRLWFNKDGKDITVQFFFENQMVSSMQSFFNDTPSLFTIETIEPCDLVIIEKNILLKEIESSPELQKELFNILTMRFQNYMELFLSRIKDSPQERYWELITKYPEIIKRIPQYYIASYLGITSVSLSRIRSRK